jgi:hypothetical protein
MMKSTYPLNKLKLQISSTRNPSLPEPTSQSYYRNVSVRNAQVPKALYTFLGENTVKCPKTAAILLSLIKTLHHNEVLPKISEFRLTKSASFAITTPIV